MCRKGIVDAVFVLRLHMSMILVSALCVWLGLGSMNPEKMSLNALGLVSHQSDFLDWFPGRDTTNLFFSNLPRRPKGCLLDLDNSGRVGRPPFSL